jgi:hypothetical protein
MRFLDVLSPLHPGETLTNGARARARASCETQGKVSGPKGEGGWGVMHDLSIIHQYERNKESSDGTRDQRSTQRTKAGPKNEVSLGSRSLGLGLWPTHRPSAGCHIRNEGSDGTPSLFPPMTKRQDNIAVIP